MDFVRNPRQATTVFGLDGSSPPRKRSSFFVRFCRTDAGQPKSGWQDKLGFVVKSIDRPSVQPEIEQVNQYNKKRQITTGYKIQPMRITLYDTADSLVMSMWNEYTKWYFGDFNQADGTNYRYDATLGFEGEDIGFGYAPRPATSTAKDDVINQNSQFFFDRIEVYQVFGGEYTQFDLINPKITTFDPDALDYAEVEVATITMSVAYEAILYKNNGQPIPIKNDSVVNDVFEGEFNGDTFDIVGGPRRQVISTAGGTIFTMDTDDFRLNRPVRLNTLTPDSGNTIGSGALGQFGNFDFGSLTPVSRIGRGAVSGDVSYLAGTNSGLAALLNLPSGSPVVSTTESDAFGAVATARNVIKAAKLDPIEGALRGAGAVNQYADRYIRNNLVGGVAASSMLSDDSAQDNLTADYPDGLALNSQSYGLINTQRPSYSQIGFNYTNDPLSAQTGGARRPGQYVPNGTPANPVPYAPLAYTDKA
jgi:hypothetical protein